MLMLINIAIKEIRLTKHLIETDNVKGDYLKIKQTHGAFIV